MFREDIGEMKKRLIPFYRNLSNGGYGYTLFIDEDSNRVFKSYHKEMNHSIYWISFAVVFILLRGMKNVFVPFNNPVVILIILLLTVVSAVIGISIYVHYYKDIEEEYFTETMIEDYIEKGKKIFIKEVISVIFVFLFVILFAVLYLIFHWLIWLIFTLFLFSMTVLGICGLPIGRFKLYRRNRNAG